ncbi:3,2-trans-enoyl-CoA isomerase [Candida viswanathii]|uniref:3,2-trans-enoyl-CoA isomerase n=1 Tax=Candida viswanathii TaxID=5486 RepID=A0A367YKB2_9ASCO|nr:3,2-trans-enoyl-CoA isomerase [Candida viswanathii]
MSDEESDILYEVRDRTAIITLNIPKRLNALNGAQYLKLGKFLERANNEEDTVLTLIQALGRFFSAGANFADNDMAKVEMSKLFSHEYWLDRFVARNIWLTNLFNDHKKILAAAVNGPVIGLSTGLLLLVDLVYVHDLNKFYLLAPFANLGLVAEGASSATLFNRLGWSKASEALLLAKPISGQDCYNAGFINKHYDGKFSSTEEFNEHVYKELTDAFENLHEDSILQNKQLLKLSRDQAINVANSQEVMRGLGKWLEGVPQTRFAQLAQKEVKHKL